MKIVVESRIIKKKESGHHSFGEEPQAGRR
jgi:hypothetical protein